VTSVRNSVTLSIVDKVLHVKSQPVSHVAVGDMDSGTGHQLLPSIFLIRERAHYTSAVGVRLETELQVRKVTRATEFDIHATT
jgi:hypothetical protein